MRLVLVTGGHGFVGSHLVDLLLQRGDRVRCLYRHAGSPASLRGRDVEIVPGDLRDPATLDRAVEGADEVYHLAALTRSVTRREILVTNTLGTRALLDAAARAGVCGRFLFCSSVAAAGPSPVDQPLDEHSPARPATWYGESKRLAELEVERRRGDLSTTVLRPPAVYGPRDRDLLPVFRAAERGFLPVLGTRPRYYHFIFVRDLAKAMLVAAASSNTIGGTYFVSHPEVLTPEGFATHVARAVGRSVRTVRLPESTLALIGTLGDLACQLTGRPPLLNGQRLRELAGRAYLASGALLERHTGFAATTGAAEGTRETTAWYREHGWLGPSRGG